MAKSGRKTGSKSAPRTPVYKATDSHLDEIGIRRPVTSVRITHPSGFTYSLVPTEIGDWKPTYALHGGQRMTEVEVRKQAKAQGARVSYIKEMLYL
jgi:ribosomal protein L32E